MNDRLVFGIKPGLERMEALLQSMGSPHKQLKFVHVAGTNGKGTCCALVSSVLREAGLKTGLTISPYVVDFRERFQIDGEMISQEELIEEVEAILPPIRAMEAAGEQVTEFECITALAFHWFARKGCDIVVLEVGLGGRFDATNVIAVPEAAVIMSISLDHTAILGNTVEEIAFEKAGILKEGGTGVLYPQLDERAEQRLQALAQERGVSLRKPVSTGLEVKNRSLSGTEFVFDGRLLKTPFLGEHQLNNALTAYACLQVLQEKGYPITGKAIQAGFAKAQLPARMELIASHPLTLLDGGHNPGCAQALKEALEAFVPQRKVAVMGMMADKDSQEAMKILAPLFEKIVTIAPDHPRALPGEKLAEIAGAYCPHVRVAQTCGEALALVLQDFQGQDALIVCGSFYLAGEIRGQLKGKMENLKRL